MALDVKQAKELNAFSCLECGKCTGTCPVSRQAGTFSPRLTLIRSIRNGDPSAFSTADLYSCLTCQQCDEICPSDIKYAQLMQLLRHSFKGEVKEGTCSHGGILESINRIMTTEDVNQNRTDWIPKEAQISKDSEYLFFVGCLPYFDVLFDDLNLDLLNSGRSTLQILNKFDIIPNSELKCRIIYICYKNPKQ